MDFLQDLCVPDLVPIVTDPLMGQGVIDIRQVCEKLGLDPEQEIARVMTDPVLSRGMLSTNGQA
jgi:hypothetical protein